MFARSVSIRLKPNGLAEFIRVIEKETIPLLRKQKGFQDEITFFAPGGSRGHRNQLVGPERGRGRLRPQGYVQKC